MNKRQIGSEYETRTLHYMKGQGMEILERNYHCRQGEVDIIARENGYLLFVEVKYRKDLQNGYPAESVTPVKQNRIRQVARYYLYEHHMPEETPVRFDVAAILGNEMQYIRDAF
ncbi:MAG: YraN family protein [Bacteroides sp.]|nr:YraN family protein [Bacteroides sp.]MCM1550867.1 YraN family protein [Clostridium sp.]